MEIPSHKIRDPWDGEHIRRFCLSSDLHDICGREIFELARVEVEIGYVLPTWGKELGTVKYSSNGFYVELDDGGIYPLCEVWQGVRILEGES